MKKVFIGKLLLLLNINMMISETVFESNTKFLSVSATHSLQLSTVLIGWFLIMLGLKELKEYSRKFDILEKIVIGVILYSCIAFVAQILIRNEALPIQSILLASSIMIIPFECLLYLGIMDIEIVTTVDVKGQKMFSKFLWTVVLSFAVQLLGNYDGYQNIVYILAFAVLIIEISILINLYVAQKKFSKYAANHSEENMVLDLK
ncbi:hypothetical protein G7059_02640 [Erysipelothrix sp. HDW6A]|uniref:hypothetical protein n=1 Tax=Erysipelothrix sp. HDW6A TaxID=2714928 RepID=UPI001407C96A|nr:hypothetical protein [Erysipelothrix sp. HDW6A]QIK56819.1 hypothetical protein G7059_02640 [Erysipelothrix sp. HDW6A]